MSNKINILIPMAGLGSRFAKEGILTPKPLIKVNGKTLIEHSVESLGIEGRYIFVTRQYDNPEYNTELTALLKKLKPDCLEVCLKEQTNGPVETCLAVKVHINNDVGLIVTNCDQRTEWDIESFLENIRNTKMDGLVVTHNSNNIKHSYAKTANNGRITQIKEKEVISNQALVGVHYWKHGYDFVESCEELLKDNKINNKQDCYISETYNYLIKKKKDIYIHQVPDNSHVFLGTLADVLQYEGKIREYNAPKPKTLFIDLDGTILKHCHRYSDLKENQELLSGVIDKFNEWDSLNFHIILVTARKPSARVITEKFLEEVGLPYNQLIMGVGAGIRYLFNDKIGENDPDRAISVNIIKDSGFGSINWKEIGL
jgi:dTDP-glucose pyrophosphorylase